MTKSDRAKSAKSKVAVLEAKLQEAEETLEAIRRGHVEALLVEGPGGPRIYTLEGADHRYRRLVETMSEGALLLNQEGLVTYANAAFAKMVERPLETIAGRFFEEFVEVGSRALWRALLPNARAKPVAEELCMQTEDGVPVPTLISTSLNEHDEASISVIVTNLSAQKRNEQMVVSERLARSILEQAAEALVVCDESGLVIRASRAARQLAVGEALRQPVSRAFPLHGAMHPALRALAGDVVMAVELTLDLPDQEPRHVLCTAAPLRGDRDEVLGCVMSMTDIGRQKRAEAERAELLAAERAARSSAERARSEAEASNRSKDEFLATVSHELRTPLNSIVGWSRVLASGELPADRQQHAIDVIRRNADAQARLVEDLLDVSRIISGRLRLEMGSVDLSRVITTVIDSVRPAVDGKQIQLDAEIMAGELRVAGDETRLQQVIWNLLSNAVKFTPAQGKVRIALCRLDSGVEIEVSDTGEGISREFLPYVFDRFRQADAGIDRLRGGLGLGLAISRHLIELHGGRIAVTSDGPGRGSTFTVRLPPSHLPQSTLVESNPRAQPTDSVRPAPTDDLRHLHVLVVEDDEDSRELCVEILRKCGARVSSTDSGLEALEMFGTDTPDILVSDVGMPKMDGYALIRNLRGLPFEPAARVPAIALTAYARAEDRQRALAEGFQVHLSKPVDPHELTTAVASLTKRRP